MTPIKAHADRTAIAACIGACAQARDGRGRWRAVDRCAVALAERSTNASLCRATAEAAGRIGAWLATQPTVDAQPRAGKESDCARA